MKQQYKVDQLIVHNLVPDSVDDTRFIAVPSGFEGEVIVIQEDVTGYLDARRLTLKDFKKEFGFTLKSKNK